MSKRFRANPHSTLDDARNCYLDTVPDEVVRLVLRYLSDRPKHRNWQAYISAELVDTALDVGGALARAGSKEFHSIGGEDGIRIWRVRDVRCLSRLVYRLPVHRLVFELRLLGNDPLDGLLRGYGAELRELVLRAKGAVVTKTDILDISTHCRRLSSFAVHDGLVDSPLTPMWRTLGSTLTRISIGWYAQYSASGYGFLDIMSVPDMARHCLNLRRVDVGKLNIALGEVLTALGSRIRVLSFEDDNKSTWNLTPWHEVFSACTNVEAVHLRLNNISLQAVNILSLTRRKVISVQFPNLHNLMSTGDRLYSVLSNCSVLRRVEFYVWEFFPEVVLRKLLASMKSVTTLTCSTRTSDANLNKTIIDAVARNLTNLQSFTIETYETLIGEDVGALVDLAHLESMTIRYLLALQSVPQPSRLSEECAVEVVRKLKDCAQLVQLEIYDTELFRGSRRIAEAAVMYHRKDFDMYIGNVQYRTW